MALINPLTPYEQWDSSITDALRYVDVFLPNEREICKLARTAETDDAIEWALQYVPMVVVKRGSRCATACTQDRRYSTPAITMKVVDAVGAGDSFNAGFCTVICEVGRLTDACIMETSPALIQQQRQAG